MKYIVSFTNFEKVTYDENEYIVTIDKDTLNLIHKPTGTLDVYPTIHVSHIRVEDYFDPKDLVDV